MNSWNTMDSQPQPGERVLVMDVNDVDAQGRPEVRVATLRWDAGRPAAQIPECCYWDVEHDQQYSVGEKWTHWARLALPTGRILKLLQKHSK